MTSSYEHGSEPSGSRSRRSEVNNKIILKEIGCDNLDWIELDQGRVRWKVLVNMVVNHPAL